MFVIQEVGVSESEMTLITGSSTLAAWMNNQCLTKWELRFERNLFLNVKEWLQKVQLCLLVRSRNPWKEKWKWLVESTFRGDQSWTYQIDMKVEEFRASLRCYDYVFIEDPVPLLFSNEEQMTSWFCWIMKYDMGSFT